MVRMFPSWRWSGVMILMLATLHGLSADSLYLKNGRRVDGVIVGQSREAIRIRTRNGVQEISKQDIRRVTYGPAPEQKTAQESKPEPVEPAPTNATESTEQAAEIPSGDAAAANETPQDRNDGEADDPNRTLRRSAVLPGWGQWSEGRPVAGTAFGVAFAVSGWFMRDAYLDYNRAGDTELSISRWLFGAGTAPGAGGLALAGAVYSDAAESARRDSFTRLSHTSLLFLAVYALNLFDAGLISTDAGTLSFDLSTTPRDLRTSTVTGNTAELDTVIRAEYRIAF